MCLDQTSAYSQSKPRAIHAAGEVAFYTVKAIEDLVQVARRDANTRIDYRDVEHIVLHPARHADLSTIRRVLDGVVQQVRDDLLNPWHVGQHPRVAAPLQHQLMLLAEV